MVNNSYIHLKLSTPLGAVIYYKSLVNIKCWRSIDLKAKACENTVKAFEYGVGVAG